jgi:hypothetical protein
MSNNENDAPPIEVTWTTVSGIWGVRVYGTSDDLTGNTVTVTTKDGKTSQVLLREFIEQRGSARIYAIDKSQ